VTSDGMTELDDDQSLEEIRNLAKDLVQHVTGIRKSAADDRGWVVVAVESASHFDESDAESLTRALRSAGVDEMVGVPTETLESEPAGLRIPATCEGLREFSHRCGHFNYFLSPPGGSFAVLCTVEDHFLITGAPEIVQVALGKGIAEAWSDFLEFAQDPDWSEEERGRLASVAEFYRSP